MAGFKQKTNIFKIVRIVLIFLAGAFLIQFFILLAACIWTHPGSSFGEIAGYMEEAVTGPSILYVPKGYVHSKEHLKMIGFQDSVDFCFYRYDSDKYIVNNPDYELLTEKDCDELKGYFANFRDCMEAGDRLKQYTFDEDCISEGDYFRIDSREGQASGEFTYEKYDNYSVWLFDTETMTLYYIHNNV